MKVELEIPSVIRETLQTLENKGFLAFLVGGCVRDLLLGKEPKDWDITTNARPEDIAAIFPKTVYENNFGTVTVINETEDQSSLKQIEITPFRLESNYSDNRHPDQIKFSTKLEDDLARRDFTINALAYDLKGQLKDLYGGISDLKDKVIRTVGSPEERFSEDALRLLRAVRFAAQLGFTINTDTAESIKKEAPSLRKISAERIRDEFSKLLMSANPAYGLNLSHQLGILEYFLPELEAGLGIEQGGEHIYDVWDHSLKAIQHAADKNYSLEIRLAVLLHDIGKPKSRRVGTGQKNWTFYGHEVVGERIAAKILERLKYPHKTKEIVLKLVRNHMFFSDPDKISMSAVRRIIVKVGPEHIWDLIKVRNCDRIGMGRPTEDPYRLRRYEAMIEEALTQPTSVAMLKTDGKRIMDVLHETPGPKIGLILNALMNMVLDNPLINTEKTLDEETIKLGELEIGKLKRLGSEGKDKIEAKETAKKEQIRKKHRV